MEGRETDLEYNLLMGLTGASVSKHLLDEHFTLLWANDFYYDMIGYPKEEYEALLIKNYGSRSKKGEIPRFELSHNALNRKPQK